MNKKETAEIKKLFSQESSCLTRICTCYVDADRKKVCTSQEAFLSLEKDEALKYNELFKSTLSGTLGKQLVNMDFPVQQEFDGGTQQFLYELRQSELKDENILNMFYDKVIENYDYPDNYYIILIHGAYDVPGVTTDGLTMEDASEEVYQFILCSICPVNMSKGGLAYSAEDNKITERYRDWVVASPARGFLFPCFNDRCADIHSVLYYSRNPEDFHPEFVEGLLGAKLPTSPGNQKEIFQSLVMETLGDEADYEVISSIHENLNEMIAEHKGNPEPLTLSKHEIKNLLEVSGVKESELEVFEEHYEEIAGDEPELVATNIINPKKLSIETPDIIIKVNSDRTDLIHTEIINGRPCFVITADEHVEINGMHVKKIHHERD